MLDIYIINYLRNTVNYYNQNLLLGDIYLETAQCNIILSLTSFSSLGQLNIYPQFICYGAASCRPPKEIYTVELNCRTDYHTN